MFCFPLLLLHVHRPQGTLTSASPGLDTTCLTMSDHTTGVQRSPPMIIEPCQITQQTSRVPRRCRVAGSTPKQRRTSGLQEAAQPAQPPHPSPLCLAASPNLFNKSSRRRPAAVMCDRRSGLTTTDPRLEFSWHRCGSQGQGVLHSLILALHNRQASSPQISRGCPRRSPRNTL